MIKCNKYNEFNELIEVECATCTKDMKVPNILGLIPECQNCYITRLESLEKEKNDGRKEAKVFKIKRG